MAAALAMAAAREVAQAGEPAVAAAREVAAEPAVAAAREVALAEAPVAAAVPVGQLAGAPAGTADRGAKGPAPFAAVVRHRGRDLRVRGRRR